MTDQSNNQGAPGYTPEQVASFGTDINNAVSAGRMTPEAAAAARAELNGQAPAKPNGGTADPALTAPDADQALVFGGKFSAREIEAMKSDMLAAVARGQMTEEQMNAQLEAANGGPVAEPNAEDPATLSEEAAAIDAAAPPAKPQDYLMPQWEGGFNADDRQADALIRNVLSQGRFDKAIGSALAAEVNRVTQKLSNMSPAERETWAQSEKLHFENKWGPEAVNEVSAFLAEWSQREGCKGVIDFFNETGATSSNYVNSQLLMHARRQAARKKQ